MAERIFQLSDQHGFDDNFQLHYGERGFEQRQQPCARIDNPSLCLGIIDNNNINLRRLHLSERDRRSIKVSIPNTGETIELTLPGKSAFIVLDPNACNKSFVRQTVETMLSSIPDRCDHLHTATAGEIEAAGWIPYWAPLQLEMKILHARLVPESILQSGLDPSDEDIDRLAHVFTRVC